MPTTQHATRAPRGTAKDERDAATGELAPLTSARARTVARGFLAGLAPTPTPEAGENVLLVVSELVTNALRHAGGVTEFALEAAGPHTVRVTVGDGSERLPRPRTPDLTGETGEATGGFGWPLVRHFAEEIDVRPDPGGGKQVRVTLPV